MRRYWIEKSQIDNATVTFTDDQFHHIFDVCRQEVGHHFEVITEDSIAYLVQVTQVGKKKAQAKVIEERRIEKLPAPHIHLALSISRYPVMDSIMERAVEMGVAVFCHLFPVIVLSAKKKNYRQPKWIVGKKL